MQDVLTLLALLIAALTFAAVAVGAVRWPLVAAPSAGVAAGLLLIVAAHLSVMEGVRWPYPVGVIVCAVVLIAWGMVVAVDDADRRRAEEEYARTLREIANGTAGGAR